MVLVNTAIEAQSGRVGLQSSQDKVRRQDAWQGDADG